MVIVGLVLIACAVGIGVWWRVAAGAHSELMGTALNTCADLVELPEGMRGQTEGVAAPSGEPLTAPFSGRECVWYEATVSQIVRERRQVTDADGHRRWETHETERELQCDTSSDPFLVSDDTGRVKVFPSGAKIDGADSGFDRSEAPERHDGKIGAVIDAVATGWAPSSQVVAVRRRERIIPAGRNVFVHGTARRSDGELALGDGDGRFVVSTRSKQELVRGHARTAAATRLAAPGLALIGLICVVAGLI